MVQLDDEQTVWSNKSRVKSNALIQDLVSDKTNNNKPKATAGTCVNFEFSDDDEEEYIEELDEMFQKQRLEIPKIQVQSSPNPKAVRLSVITDRQQ
jgi:glycine cleavage system regulatory protein